MGSHSKDCQKRKRIRKKKRCRSNFTSCNESTLYNELAIRHAHITDPVEHSDEPVCSTLDCLAETYWWKGHWWCGELPQQLL